MSTAQPVTRTKLLEGSAYVLRNHEQPVLVLSKGRVTDEGARPGPRESTKVVVARIVTGKVHTPEHGNIQFQKLLSSFARESLLSSVGDIFDVGEYSFRIEVADLADFLHRVGTQKKATADSATAPNDRLAEVRAVVEACTKAVTDAVDTLDRVNGIHHLATQAVESSQVALKKARAELTHIELTRNEAMQAERLAAKAAAAAAEAKTTEEWHQPWRDKE